MTELCADVTGEQGLIVTAAAMGVLAGVEEGTPELRAELERSGWLVGGAPPADLAPVFEAWAQPLATIELLVRHDGSEHVVRGCVDEYLAVLLVAVAPGDEARHVVAMLPEAVPRWIGHAVGLGLRPVPGDEDPAVALSWEAVDRCLGLHGADDIRDRARAGAEGRAAAEHVDAVLAPAAKRWRARLDGAGEWSGAFGVVIDVLDAGDRGLFVVAASDTAEAEAEALPCGTGDVWRLLANGLVVPFDEDPDE